MSKFNVAARLTRISPRSIRSVQIAPLRCVIGPEFPILGSSRPIQPGMRVGVYQPRERWLSTCRGILEYFAVSRDAASTAIS